MTSSNFGATIIGEATQDCVNKLGDILSQQATTMKKTVREVETRVADISGGTMVIAAGANDGVNVGETFEILKVLREVRDPQTKEVLDTVTEKTGEMTITNVRDKIATGTYVGKAAAVELLSPVRSYTGPIENPTMYLKTTVFALLACAAVAPAQQKKALSIDPFDYSAVMTSVQAIFGTQMNIGQGIQAMMTKRIAQDGRFTVIERRKVNEMIHEQDFDAGNRVKKGTGARVGQIRGADLTLMGDIVVFGRDDRRVGEPRVAA